MKINKIIKNIFYTSRDEATDKFIIYDNKYNTCDDIIEHRPYLRRFKPELITINDKPSVVVLLDNSLAFERMGLLSYNDSGTTAMIVIDKSIDKRLDGYILID